MTGFLTWAAVFVLATVALGLVRALRGPAAADRVMAVQLLGTGGMAVLVLLSFVLEELPLLDVALTLALLAAFAAVAFVRAASSPDLKRWNGRRE